MCKPLQSPGFTACREKRPHPRAGATVGAFVGRPEVGGSGPRCGPLSGRIRAARATRCRGGNRVAVEGYRCPGCGVGRFGVKERVKSDPLL